MRNTILVFDVFLFSGVLPLGAQTENHRVLHGYPKDEFLTALFEQSKT